METFGMKSGPSGSLPGRLGASAPAAGPIVDVRGVRRRFEEALALDDVSLAVPAGEIHALLGPNGAGKTTLLRILAGLLAPSEGSVRILGDDAFERRRAIRSRVGLVPSGDRTFYLRISGLENLVFFARLYGLSRKQALARAREVLAWVGLEGAARKRVGLYSHGMQKRLSIARAFLTDPALLLVDEATHDLDPEGSRTVRELVADVAEQGAAVVWATQRLDEIRGFAHRVTLLSQGTARFTGLVAELVEYAAPRRYVVQVRNGKPGGEQLRRLLENAIGGFGRVAPVGEGESEHYVLALGDRVVLGDALAALMAAEVQILACRQERSEIEEAFFALTQGEPA